MRALLVAFALAIVATAAFAIANVPSSRPAPVCPPTPTPTAAGFPPRHC